MRIFFYIGMAYFLQFISDMKTNRWVSPIFVLLIGLILSTLILPLPLAMMDTLILLNLSLSLFLLVKSLYVSSPLKLASFPSLILISTLFRLGVNIASTRLILSRGEAGHIVSLLGQLSTQGNIMVGLIVFAIITIVQFIIVAKGSERVAEVAARFTLDALPGKQMSIDADLRAGLLTQNEAKSQREALHRESRFYGAMDGAMKFIKGDAIAGLILILINLLGGFYTGVVQQGYDLGYSVLIYSTLTIGDGLISQMASILVALTAGFLITRVHEAGDPQSLGSDIAKQIFSQHQVYYVVGLLFFIVGLLPNVPWGPFIFIALSFLCIGFSLSIAKNKNLVDSLGIESITIDESKHRSGLALPLVIEMGPKLYATLQHSTEWGQCFNLTYPKLRTLIGREMGMEYPELKIRINPNNSNSSKYVIKLFEIPVESGYLSVDHCGMMSPDDSAKQSCERVIHTEHGTPLALWNKKNEPQLNELGYKVYSPQELVLRHLAKVLKRHAADFVDMQQVRNTLERTEEQYPELVREVVPRMISLQKLTEVLKRLVEESIPIRDMRLILQSLAFSYPDNKDTVYLTEQVRIGLRKTISHLYAKDQSIKAYQLSPQIEEEIRASIQKNGAECYVALSPERLQYILTSLHEKILDKKNTKASILTAVDIRRYVKKIVDHYNPDLPVLSFQELDPKITIAPMGLIG